MTNTGVRKKRLLGQFYRKAISPPDLGCVGDIYQLLFDALTTLALFRRRLLRSSRRAVGVKADARVKILCTAGAIFSKLTILSCCDTNRLGTWLAGEVANSELFDSEQFIVLYLVSLGSQNLGQIEWVARSSIFSLGSCSPIGKVSLSLLKLCAKCFFALR